MKFGGEYKASISQLGDCTSFFYFFFQLFVCVLMPPPAAAADLAVHLYLSWVIFQGDVTGKGSWCRSQGHEPPPPPRRIEREPSRGCGLRPKFTFADDIRDINADKTHGDSCRNARRTGWRESGEMQKKKIHTLRAEKWKAERREAVSKTNESESESLLLSTSVSEWKQGRRRREGRGATDEGGGQTDKIELTPQQMWIKVEMSVFLSLHNKSHRTWKCFSRMIFFVLKRQRMNSFFLLYTKKKKKTHWNKPQFFRQWLCDQRGPRKRNKRKEGEGDNWSRLERLEGTREEQTVNDLRRSNHIMLCYYLSVRQEEKTCSKLINNTVAAR